MWAEKQVLVMNKQPEEATRGVNKRYSQKFRKYTGKHLCQSLFFNKVAGLWHRCLPVSFPKFLRTLFYRKPLVAASKPLAFVRSNCWRSSEVSIQRCLLMQMFLQNVQKPSKTSKFILVALLKMNSFPGIFRGSHLGVICKNSVL